MDLCNRSTLVKIRKASSVYITFSIWKFNKAHEIRRLLSFDSLFYYVAPLTADKRLAPHGNMAREKEIKQ